MPYPMGVFEALEAWQQGEITYRRALRVLGVDTIADLYAAAVSSGVPIRIEATPAEMRLADRATALIMRARRRALRRRPHAPAGGYTISRKAV